MLGPIEKAADELSIFVLRSCNGERKTQRLDYGNKRMSG